MWTEANGETKHITDYRYRRLTVDLTRQDIQQDDIVCEDMEDFSRRYWPVIQIIRSARC